MISFILENRPILVGIPCQYAKFYQCCDVETFNRLLKQGYIQDITLEIDQDLQDVPLLLIYARNRHFLGKPIYTIYFIYHISDFFTA